MKYNIQLFILLVISMSGFTQPLLANHETKDSLRTSKDDSLGERIFTIGLDYASNQTFKGRNTGQKQPYYAPYFNYQAKSGFYFYTSFMNVIAAASDTTEQATQARKYKIDQWQINPGYNFNINKKTTSSVSFTHYFTKDTMLITYGIKNNIDYYMDHNFGFINEKLSLDLDLGTQTDFSISLESYHSFDIDNPFTKDNDMLSFIPGFTFTAGTQNFYNTKVNRVKPRGRGTVVTTSTTTFNLIAFDFSLPVSYTIGSFTIEGAFNYSAPMNEPAGSTTKPFGYATASISFDF